MLWNPSSKTVCTCKPAAAYHTLCACFLFTSSHTEASLCPSCSTMDSASSTSLVNSTFYNVIRNCGAVSQQPFPHSDCVFTSNVVVVLWVVISRNRFPRQLVKEASSSWICLNNLALGNWQRHQLPDRSKPPHFIAHAEEWIWIGLDHEAVCL